MTSQFEKRPRFYHRLLPVVMLVFAVLPFGCGTGATPKMTPTSTLSGTIRITGAGTVYPALRPLAEAFKAKNRGVEIVFLPDNQTGGGITAVKSGVAEIGAVTRTLKPEEAEGDLQYAEIAKDALLIAVNSSVTGVTNLRTEDLRAIYGGKIQSWKQVGGPEAQIIVLDRPEDESTKILLRQYVLGKELVIAPSAVTLKAESELINALKDTANSIGAFSLAFALANGLKVNKISLDGVAPTQENVKNGQYKIVRSLGIIWQGGQSAAVGAFREYIASPEGARILLDNGYAPVTVAN